MDGVVRRFHRIYICLAACKQGWLKGCRPIIGLDGCHIKGQHPGQLLAEIGIDANNGMFPIAYAVAEVENTETWRWFLEYLIWDLQIDNGFSYTFITDKQKGLSIAIQELVPNAEHRHCVRHMYNNFKGTHPGAGLKQTVWNAARSSTLIWYNRHMENLKRQSDDAYKWFEDKFPEHWTRSHFRTNVKCDILLNNLCESWNAAILKFRGKPIITMLDGIMMDTMVRMANRRVAGMRWRDHVGPRIAKILDKIGQRTSDYRAYVAGEYKYQVVGGMYGSKHAVDLEAHTCTCRRWQLSGIPCVHAICAIFAKKQDPALYVDEMLSQTKYIDAYSPIINPIAGENDWEQIDYPIAPPPYKRQAGRPKMKRIKEAGEKMAPPAPNTAKMSRSQYVKMTCTTCGKKGHNLRGCLKNKAVASSSQVGGDTQTNVGTKRMQKSQNKKAPAPKRQRNTKDQVISSRNKSRQRKVEEGKKKETAQASTSRPVQQPPSQPRQEQMSQTMQYASQNTSQPSQVSDDWAWN